MPVHRLYNSNGNRIFEILHVFFFNDTATTEIYTLSLHDALPISNVLGVIALRLPEILRQQINGAEQGKTHKHIGDRKSTRLNSSHMSISYAVFCLKKKKKIRLDYRRIKQQIRNNHYI